MISVIVPVYQAERYLNRCIESILNQKYQDIEVLLIDDGSTDNSGSICDNYAKKDVRIKVLHKKNAGVSAARNSGLEIASGDYITFVDSDDYIDSDMYQEMIQTAEHYGCDVVMCDCVKESETHSTLYTHDIRPGFYNKEMLYKEYYQHLLMMENVEYPATISNCLILFRRKLSSGKVIPRYVEGVRFSEDLFFGAQLLYAANSFYYMKGQAYYHYWVNLSSATHTFRPDKWNDYMKLHQEMNRYFGACNDFDFAYQLDLTLLFFVYNAIGDIRGAMLDENLKIEMCKNILRTRDVREMFKRLKIRELSINKKLKIVTYIYKYEIGLNWWIKREK